MFISANLRPIQRWMDPDAQYSLWLLERPPFYFPLLKCPSKPQNLYSMTPFGMPSVEEWKHIWDAWDFITLRMIPPSMLHQKPIDLRHICLFYLGHIPTFLDIHLSRLLNEPHTEPENFKVCSAVHVSCHESTLITSSLSTSLRFVDTHFVISCLNIFYI